MPYIEKSLPRKILGVLGWTLMLGIILGGASVTLANFGHQEQLINPKDWSVETAGIGGLIIGGLLGLVGGIFLEFFVGPTPGE